jgi:hypothetical protein
MTMMTQAEFEAMLDSATNDEVIAASQALTAQRLLDHQNAVQLAKQPKEYATSGRPHGWATQQQPAQVESAFVAIEDSDVIARTMRGQLTEGKRKAFVLAGNALFTLRSKATQTRFTFKVVQSDPAKCRAGQFPVYFVSLLNGSDNTGDFAYIGTIFADGFRVTRKSRVAADAPSAIAFSWFMKHLEDSRVEVWLEGRCGRCGRTLTVPESIESGLGPICASK